MYKLRDGPLEAIAEKTTRLGGQEKNPSLKGIGELGPVKFSNRFQRDFSFLFSPRGLFFAKHFYVH